MVKKFT